MFTKSKIQQITETLECKNSFKEGLNQLMEKYNIEDSIFVFVNGQAKEVTKGYFTIKEEYDNLKDAVSNCDITSNGIRIMENSKFQIGCIYGLLSACPKDDKILDISNIEYV